MRIERISHRTRWKPHRPTVESPASRRCLRLCMAYEARWSHCDLIDKECMRVLCFTAPTGSCPMVETAT
jgi:hypothetical protein